MTVLDLLRDTRILLADPAHWCKGHFALTATGKSTSHHGDHACRWCVTGALFKLLAFKHDNVYHQVRCLLMDCIPVGLESRHNHALAAYNDRPETTHSDVLAWLDAAIAIAPAEAKPQATASP
jgi:hypothetical protein